jgi:tetratricopeptide (TPR) repeat protein
MKIAYLFTAVLLATTSAPAQRHKLSAIVTSTPEGKILQQIGQENDPARKIALLEEFASAYPKHDAYGWVLSQMQVSYEKTGEPDKVLAVGEKLLAIDSEDIDAAYANLKAAQKKNDPDLVIKWATQTSEIGRRVKSGAKPANMDAEDWKQAVDFATQMDTFTEYAIYSTALQSNDPQKTMQLVEALETRNPQSQYIAPVLAKYAHSARQVNALPKAVQYGEKAFGRGQFNEDMLIAMSDYYMQQNNPEKVLLYTNKAVELMGSKPKPEGIADADWQKKKASITGLANWMSGVTLSGQSKFSQADKALRAALPDIGDNEQLRGMALFHLGLANYKMGQAKKSRAQIAEGLKFSEQSAALKSPLQAQAGKNVKAIRGELGTK